jgi:nucleoside-diphosphate-sugar epimerase
MTRVLVTGGTGFVGKPAVAALQRRGLDVFAASRADADLLDPADINRLVGSIRPTHLLHLAWCTEPGRYWTSPDNAAWEAASVHLLRRFAESGGRRAVVAGTSAEYDWTAPAPFHEATTPIRPATIYGRAKDAVHLAAQAIGVQLAWARLFGMYGPGEPEAKLVSKVITTLLRGEAFRGPAPADLRDFLFIEDVAEALAALVADDAIGAFNVGSGRGIAISTLVETIATQLGRPDLIEADRAPSGDAPAVVADITRLTSVVPWKPIYTLDRGIGETIEYWRRRTRVSA